MEDVPPQKKRRNLPHWTIEGGIYFVTFRAVSASFTSSERQVILDHILAGNHQFYVLIAVTIMPDHAHLLLKPQAGFPLSRIMKGMKGVSANLINKLRQTTGQPVWQDESWNRIMRDSKELEEKFDYMANNPIEAGLAKTIEEYVGWYCAADLM